MTTASAQINVRLDANLKRIGDAALSSAGMTPSWDSSIGVHNCLPSPAVSREST